MTSVTDDTREFQWTIRSLTKLTYCFIFPTNNREPWLTRHMIDEIGYHAGYLCERNGGRVILADGGRDYLELHISLFPKTSVSETVRLLKAQLSRFVKEEYAEELSKFYGPKMSVWSTKFFIQTIGVRDEEMIQYFLDAHTSGPDTRKRKKTNTKRIQ